MAAHDTKQYYSIVQRWNCNVLVYLGAKKPHTDSQSLLLLLSENITTCNIKQYNIWFISRAEEHDADLKFISNWSKMFKLCVR